MMPEHVCGSSSILYFDTTDIVFQDSFVWTWSEVMADGTAVAVVLCMVLLLQLRAICSQVRWMCKITPDNKGGNDIQLMT